MKLILMLQAIENRKLHKFNKLFIVKRCLLTSLYNTIQKSDVKIILKANTFVHVAMKSIKILKLIILCEVHRLKNVQNGCALFFNI